MKINKGNVFRIVWFSLIAIFFIWQWSTYQSQNLPVDTFVENETIGIKENKDKITFFSKNNKNRNEK